MVVYLILKNLKKAYFDDSAIEYDHYFLSRIAEFI